MADQRNARFQKAISVAKAIADTAIAIVKALGEGDPYTKFARAVAIGAVGAAQVADIIATPIPKYRHSTLYHPGRLAIVGDGGKRELVLIPDWNIIAKAGMLSIERIHALSAAKHSDPGGSEALHLLKGELRGIKQAINGKKETHFHWDNGQLKTSIKNGDSWIRYINELVKG